MVERVLTGGTMPFAYDRNHAPKLDKESEAEIDKAYNKYYERKRKEKRKTWLIIILILMILIATFLLVTSKIL